MSSVGVDGAVYHSGCIVTANAYFASVKSGNKDEREGPFFIGNIKQCSRRFLMEVLGNASLRQLNKLGRAQPDKVIVDVDVPKAIKMYYKGAGTINWHNRICATELRIDRNLATKHWDKRFNLDVLGIICIDAYLFFPTGHPCGQQDDELP
jgi:hypothetical protein